MCEIKYEDLPIISTGPFRELTEEEFLRVISVDNNRKWGEIRKSILNNFKRSEKNGRTS